MKIRFYLALAAAALVMTNCSQDEELVQVKQSTKGFTATIEGASRSDVTEAGVFSWTAGDAISVWNGSTFDVYANSEGNESTFVAEDEEAGTPTGYAIYPAGNHAISGSDVTINLPTTYAHGSTNAPMLATIESGSSTLAFKHLGGLMRFVVKNVPVGASSFVFTTTNNILTGSYTVDSEDEIKQNGEGIVTANNNNVTIKFNALEEVAESMVFFVPLPVGTYGEYTVAIEGDNLQGTYSHTSTGVTNTIGRCTMLLMPEFNVENGELKKGAGNTIPVNQDEAANLSGIQNVTIGTDNAGTNEELDINYTPLEGNAILNITDDSNATESQDSKAKIKIIPTDTDTQIESLNLNTPSLTAELGAGTYGTVEALTAKQTLIIAEGVTIETLILNGGALEVAEGATIGEIIVKDEAGLNSAVAAGKATLGADVTLTEALTISNDVTLDLNGKTLTGTVEGYLFESSGNLTISNGSITNVGGAVLTKGGSLKMTDCKVTVTGGKWEYNAVEVTEGTTAEITGGWYKSTGTLAEGERDDWYGIGIVAGTVTLNTTVEGTFNGGVTLAPKVAKTPTVTITGGSYSGNKYHGLNMNGGILTIEGEPTFSGNGGDIRVYTKTGTINGVGFGFTIDGQKTYTLDELEEIIATETFIQAIAKGGEVTLETDVTLTEALTIANDVTLDLNGNTLTGTVEGYLFESSGNLTISNGSITNVGGAVLTKGGSLKMTDCKVTVTGGKWEYNAVEVTEGTNAEITGGWYKSTGTLAEGERDDWYGIGIVAGTVTLNTTVEGTFNGGVTLAPKVAGTPTVTITGGSYSGNKYHGLNMNGGILTIEGEPTFSGNGGDIRVYTKTGTINGVGFGDQGNKTYTFEQLMSYINSNKSSAE